MRRKINSNQVRMTQMLELADGHYKVIIITVFQMLKKIKQRQGRNKKNPKQTDRGENNNV